MLFAVFRQIFADESLSLSLSLSFADVYERIRITKRFEVNLENAMARVMAR